MRDLRLQVVLHQQAPLRWPLVETPSHWLVLGFDADLNEAFRLCLRNAVEFLVRCAGMSTLDAYGLCSVAVSFRVTQVVDGNKGVHGMIPKDIFTPEARREIDPLGRG